MTTLLQDLDQSSDVELECSVESNPAPSSYVWTKTGDSEFRQSGQYLRLRSVTHRESGEYVCSVNNVLSPTHGVPSER